ncbi:acyl-CoA synthetase FdrA [Clostridium sp. MCC353]|uniref:acyl-CoA synthetase FdrA n=1 Tax=Clostridium sp. MCC353 TaxID=2592646 RepID=UPI001C02E109|nr:acyl-CoA synthetase FdrA [Clostridium sp. MCC353]MBT9776770.1 acyl-CoA synthetase FdrA [Clostridium sp. MCC353]
MIVKNVIKTNQYYDSATLMLLTSKIGRHLGSAKHVAVMMATDMNKDLMEASGLLTDEGREAGANDLVFAIRGESEEEINKVLLMAEEELNTKAAHMKKESQDVVKTVEEAVSQYPNASMAVVSLPGQFAAREVKKLLMADRHVLLFSDNVSLEEERKLKDLALERGLLMMGPDCGTAVINGVGLGFSNQVKRGNIGLAAASGTGLQEVMCQISNRGGGISQAFGTGGRDVKEAIGGRMMLSCLELLENDHSTDVIVIVSKPPSPSVLEKIAAYLRGKKKPVVACFMGNEGNDDPSLPWKTAAALDETARLAVELAGTGDSRRHEIPAEMVSEAMAQRTLLQPGQKYIRGLYCGGTLAYETMLLIRSHTKKVYSNIAVTDEERIDGLQASKEHTVLDLGDDEFTVGKPHPMIEPSLREERLLQEAADPETAVILADVETGYGSHENPARVLAEEVAKAQEILKEQNRHIIFVASICGSYEDFQDYEEQKRILKQQGILVMESNAQAAELALAIMEELEKEGNV